MAEIYTSIHPESKGKTIYSIPIKEAFEKDGCPYCTLCRDAEARSLEYIFGGAHMEPSEREIMNTLGFCREHMEKLLGMKNRLSLALVLASRMSEMLEGRAPLAHGCYICAGLSSTQWAFFENTVHLWTIDKMFAAQLRERSNLCLEHAGGLAAAGAQKLKGAKKQAFFSDIHAAVDPKLSAALQKLRGFIGSFDHRNSATPLSSDERRALEAAIELLSNR